MIKLTLTNEQMGEIEADVKERLVNMARRVMWIPKIGDLVADECSGVRGVITELILEKEGQPAHKVRVHWQVTNPNSSDDDAKLGYEIIGPHHLVLVKAAK